MDRQPETMYARTTEGAVAYQVFGRGPRDVLFIQNWGSNIEVMWEEVSLARYFERLASFARVIVFDKRGTGISDPVPLERLPTLERWMDDARVVLDAVGVRQASVIGDTEGGPMAMLLAATHPERMGALVLVNSFARLARAADYRIGLPAGTRERLIEAWRREWGTGTILELTAPSFATDMRLRRWFGRYQRLSMAPQQAELAYRWVLDVDVRSVLPSIQAPTLVIARLGNRYYRPAYGRFLGDQIPGARLVELPGPDVYPFHLDAEPVLTEVEAFLTGVRPAPPASRVLATVLFTDIVDSTGHAFHLGDRRWLELLARHRDVVREQLARHEGREVATTGDGFVATFDGPGRALRCGSAIVERVGELGVQVRGGVHTGEIDVAGNDISGIAVHIAARVQGAASPSSVWVTETVRELVIGSGIEFEPRGQHELRGVPGSWNLYEVTSTGTL